MIFTAGHCVYSSSANAFVMNFTFIPQYDNSYSVARPFGTWTARFIYAMANWIYNTDFNSDVAAVLLYTLNGRHIQDVVGSVGIRFYSAHFGLVHSFGYPVNYINAQVMTYCSGTKYFANLNFYTGDGMPCGMISGCSGGPWLESFSFSTLHGIQTSVNSFLITTQPNVIYGPYFGSSVQSLYNAAKVNSSTNINRNSAYWCSSFVHIMVLFGLYMITK